MDLRAAHRRHNRTTRDAWRRYAPHRARVMGLLEAGPAGTLAILGAGNCNDVDLAGLAARFDAIALLDIDTKACRAAARRAGVEVAIHDVDLSGVLGRLTRWRRQPPGPDELRALPAAAVEAVRAAVPARFDVVLTSGVLSQLVWSAMETFAVTDPALRGVALGSVVAHLQVASSLLRPGGALVVVADTLARPPDFFRPFAEVDPLDLLVGLESRGLCLPGTELGVVSQALALSAVDVGLAGAWLWAVSPQRTHLVYALRARAPTAATG